MIVYKEWKRTDFSGLTPKRYQYKGWFLLGFIPLYIVRWGSE